jgi:hypothetical protein
MVVAVCSPPPRIHVHFTSAVRFQSFRSYARCWWPWVEGSSSRGYPHTEVHILSQHNQIRLLRHLTGADVNASGMPVAHVPALLNWILSLGVGRLGCGDGFA